MTDADRIAALEAKVALLSATIRQADAQALAWQIALEEIARLAKRALAMRSADPRE